MSKQQRLKSREMRKAQTAIAAQRGWQTNWLVTVGGLVIVGLLAAIGFVVFQAASKDDATGGGKLVTPANLTAGGAIPVGQATSPVTVEIYLDYMCPACGKFEQANAGEIDRLVKAGTAKLELRPISFLDKTSQGSRYSTRAANAMATVADRAPDKVWAFNTELFDHQPQEGTRGLTDAEIAELATKAGIAKDVVDAFTKRTFERWVAEATDTAFKKAGVQGTPTVKINGTVFEGNVYTAGPLTQAIEAAAGGAR